MGKFFIKDIEYLRRYIEFNEFLKSKWNSLMYQTPLFKKEQK